MGNPHTSLWINTSLQVNYFSTFRTRVDPVVHCQLKVKVKVAQSSLTLLRPLYSPWNSSGQNTGLGSLSLLQGIFPTQGLNLGLPHCRQNFLPAVPQGKPRILERVAYPFSSGSSQPRNQTRVSWIAGGFFTNWAMREHHRLEQCIFTVSL